MATLNSFRTARWVRTFNLLLQAVLFVTLFAGLNYLARNHPSRFDLTRHHQYSLSPETLSYLSEKNLQRPVRIVVTVPAESDNPDIAQARRDLGGLLNEYRYATEGNPVAKIKVEYLDVYQRRRDAEQLGIDQPNSILVLSGDRRRLVSRGGFA